MRALQFVRSSGVAIVNAKVFTTYSMHTERQALSTYTNFPFNSFCEFNGKFYGASDAGLFEITGATDNNTPIAAIFTTGITDFDSAKTKRVDRVYSNMRGGALNVRVIADESSSNSYTIQGGATLHPVRAILGRGVTGRNWQFEITNVSGSSFTIQGLEVKPQILDRRLGGRYA
jgi:hypothetical protein